MKTYHFEVTADSGAGLTLERFLLEVAALSPRSALKKALRAGSVALNARKGVRSDILKAGDRIELQSDGLFRREELLVHPNPTLPLSILKQTELWLAVNKPAGQSAHPLRPDEQDTTLNAIAGRFAPCAKAPETIVGSGPKPLEGLLVHRIDRGTSGALVCAKNPEAWSEIREAWKSREIEKVYLAWVHGSLKSKGTLEIFLSHDPKSKKRMQAHHSRAADEASWKAITSLFPLREENKQTLVLVRIHTGVMHQIRATCAALGHPIVGDEIYEHRAKASAQKFQLHGFDAETQACLKRAQQALRSHGQAPEKLKTPERQNLPERGFFLHALWLRSDVISGMGEGVFAPLPEHWLKR